MPTTLNYCTHCGQLVDAYPWSTVEPGNPAGDRTFYCRTCGIEWPAPNAWTGGEPCERCGECVAPQQRYCAACGERTRDLYTPTTPPC